ETFVVTLTSPVNAALTDNQGTGTIIDDDGFPTLVINDVTVTEGDAGTTDAVFTVSLSAASLQAITVDFATANGTALALADYTTQTGTLTFAPGITAQQITVIVQDRKSTRLNSSHEWISYAVFR